MITGSGSFLIDGEWPFYSNGNNTAGTNNIGVWMYGTPAPVISVLNGTIEVEGGLGTLSGTAIELEDATTLSADSTISLFGASISIGSEASISSPSGAVGLHMLSPAAAIDLGSTVDTTPKTLELSDAELDRITAATIEIYSGGGPITVSANISRQAATHVYLYAGGDINFATGSIDTGGGDLTLSPGSLGWIYVPQAGNDVSVGATGTLSFESLTTGSTLFIGLGGGTADSQYDQLNVVGNIDLSGVVLVVGLGFQPLPGDKFTIINNVGSGTTTGEFQNVGVEAPERNVDLQLDYHGGDGNDVVLTAINIAPRLDPISDPNPIDEDAVQRLMDLTGLSAGNDGSTILKVTAVSSNPGLIPDPDVTFSAIDGTGSLSYRPLPDQFGTAVIIVTVQDDGGTDSGGVDTFSRTFTVGVLPVNDPPSFVVGGIGGCSTADEDATTHGPPLQQTCGSFVTNIKAGPPNESDQPLTFGVTNNNPALFKPNGQPTLDSSGNLTFTRMPNTSGNVILTITLSDNNGGSVSSQLTLSCTLRSNVDV